MTDILLACRGNWTDPESGELVATIVPGLGGDQGMFSNDGQYFFPQGNMAIQFEADQKYAFMQYTGVGYVVFFQYDSWIESETLFLQYCWHW
jgi:hypothetical protein